MTTSASNQLVNDTDEYKCTLNAEYQKIALDLLGEDESTRNQALSQFREWINKHTNIINCRLDTSFLLRFLRMKRFYVPDACQILERYLLFRHNNPQWTKNIDVRDPELRKLLSSGVCFPLPVKSHSGRPILFYNLAKYDTEQLSFSQIVRVAYVMLELIISDEETQVTGCNHIADDSGITMALIASWPIGEIKDFMAALTKVLPLRHSKFCVVQLPSYASGFLQLLLSCVSDKIRGRFEYHKNFDAEELYKDLNRSVLPKEYGGEVSSSEMIAIAMKKLEAKRDELLLLDEISIREAKVFSEFYQTNEESMNGTFRKLAID